MLSKKGRNSGNISHMKRIAIIGTLAILLGALFVYIPEEVKADSKPGGTLKNDQSAESRRTTHWWWTADQGDELLFKFPTKTNYYTAVAIMNRAAGEDYDVFAYDDYDMTQKIAYSTKGSDAIDLVVIDGHTYSGNYKYAKVIKFSGSDWTNGVRIESDYHCVQNDLYGSDPDDDGCLEVGTYRYSMFELHSSGYSGTLDEDPPIVNMYDIYLEAGGEYDFDIASVPNTERLGMYLFKGSGNFDNTLVSDVSSISGGSLSMSYDPEITGWYGLAVIDH
ncbi:MAG: hypothetical protein U9R75_00095, partial [Candidatus Thermoplasmatota archaeon]|nr:hypothetical protein [Candidatus Thermoplasmatota archaeon]